MKLQKKVKIKEIKPTSDDKKSPASWPQLIGKYGRWLIILEMMLILGIGLFFLVRPKWVEVTSDTAGGLSYWQNELASVERDLIDVQKLVKLYNSLNRAERDKLYKILPDQNESEKLMTQVEALLDSQELILTSFSVNQVADLASAPTHYSSLNLNIDFSGLRDYQHYKDVIRSLESFIRVMNIDNIYYNTSIEDMSVVATIYYKNK